MSAACLCATPSCPTWAHRSTNPTDAQDWDNGWLDSAPYYATPAGGYYDNEGVIYQRLVPRIGGGLVALVAPRPVLFANATEDTWANPAGQFDVLRAADPVYRLLGTDGLAAEKMPESEKLVDSTLGYYIRPGKHSMTKGDWKVFLDFADKHLGKP